MKIGRWLIALCLLLVGCAEPLPPERLDYVGQWQAPGMTLLILADGSVSYQRIRGGATVSVNGPLQAFIGNDFSVGLGPLSTQFSVSVAPHEREGVWYMTVDGVDLTRVAR